MKIVILDGAAALGKEFTFDRLEKYGEVVYYPRTKHNEIIERGRDADIILLNKVVINREILDQLPNLKLIQVLATGYNVVDIEYAREKGIVVCNIPSYSTPSVAQLTIAHILECVNAVGKHNESVKNGDWTNCPDFCYSVTPQTELAGKTIGLIGYGDIARKVAKICNALDMNVLGYRRTPTCDEYATMVSLDELYRHSDIISLHCPATPETIGMINSDSIAKMKDGVIIINTARGIVVDEQAVADNLSNGKIAHYCADVLSSEPPTADNPLLRQPNAIITPHIAWASVEARGRLFDIMEDNISNFLNGNILNRIN